MTPPYAGVGEGCWLKSKQFAQLQTFIEAVVDTDDVDLMYSAITDRAVRLHKEFEDEQERRCH